MVKGENATYFESWNPQGIFASTSSFITYGNVMSLVYGDNFSGQTTLNDWTNNGSYSGNFQYGAAYNGDNAMFCDYTTINSEFWKGDFYWVYMSFNVLTDEQIQQVIDYNENL